MKSFRNGLVTGLTLQFAIGPVFFFIMNLTLQKTILDGLVGVVAVTLVDYFYIALAILGISKLFENKRFKKVFGAISSMVLVIFGLFIIEGVARVSTVDVAITTASTNTLSSFVSLLFLTISNPMTIIFFTSLFAAKAVEYNYTKKDLVFFGVGTGL